jgi:hypothetical protein
MEIQGLHSQLSGMVSRGQLSARKIASLIELRETVNRFAQCNYVEQAEIDALKEKYGAEPEIISWGDYFQTEVASRHFDMSDEEFLKIIDTVRFDLVSSTMIFRNKSEEFCDQVREEAIIAAGTDRQSWTTEQEQAAHMGILLQYFEQLHLSSCEIADVDQRWFESFLQQSSRGTG